MMGSKVGVFTTLSTSPMQNITATMYANCMMLLKVTAIIMACGTRVRAPFTSSPTQVSVHQTIEWISNELTHVKNSIKRCDWKRHRDKSNAKSNTWVIP